MKDTPEVGDLSAQPKAEPKSPMKIVREVLSLFHPIAQVGDTIYRQYEHGWQDATDDVGRYAAEQSNQCPEKYGVMSALSKFIHIPRASDYCSTPYFKWFRDEAAHGEKEERINSRWLPYLFDTDSVCFANGALNVRNLSFQTWEQQGITVFGPTITMRYEDTVAPEPTEKFKEFLKSLEEALPDPAARLHFQKVMAMILQPHVSRKQGVFIIGDAGSRKSTKAMAILCAPAGVGGFSIQAIDDLADHKHSSIALIGKWANLSDDAGQGRKWVSWFKRYTGSSIMQGEFKYVNPRNYPATAKLIICCNEMPYMGDSSDAIWTRLQVFRFERSGQADAMFRDGTGDERYLMASYWSDKGTRACILNWLLEGLRRGMIEGRQPPPCVVEWNRAGTAEADPVRQVLLDQFEKGNGFVASEELMQAIRAESNRHFKPNDLMNYVRNLYPKAKPDRQMVNGVRVRGFSGIIRRGDK